MRITGVLSYEGFTKDSMPLKITSSTCSQVVCKASTNTIGLFLPPAWHGVLVHTGSIVKTSLKAWGHSGTNKLKYDQRGRQEVVERGDLFFITTMMSIPLQAHTDTPALGHRGPRFRLQPDEIPLDIWTEVVEKLDGIEVLRLSQVCNYLPHRMANASDDRIMLAGLSPSS